MRDRICAICGTGMGQRECPTCGGEGIEWDHTPCYICGGKGKAYTCSCGQEDWAWSEDLIDEDVVDHFEDDDEES